MVPYSVCVLCGEQNVDYWDLARWAVLLEEHQILVATAQVIVDAIKKKFLELQQINVLVFDECHHGCKDHPYHELMKQFSDSCCNDVRIIGLSGMLIGNSNKIKPSTVTDELKNLEATFASTVITVNNQEDYDKCTDCSTNAQEVLVRFIKQPAPQSVESISKILAALEANLSTIKLDSYITVNPRTLLPTTPGKVKDLIKMISDFDYQSKEMGPFGGYLSLLSSVIQLELIKRWCDTEQFKTVVKTCITVFERCVGKIKLNLDLSNDDPLVILNNSSHKIRRLLELLRQQFTDPKRVQDLQCLIFVKRRSTAKGIYHILKAIKKYDESFPIEPDFMVGVNNEMPESIEAILSTSFNSIVLEKFKNRETNCIVTSSVLEEGIDLQMCNLVVMYDKPDTYRSYVQARGRARVNNSTYAVMVEDENVRKFNNKVVIWRQVDETLKKELLMKTLNREPPNDDDIQEQRRELWPPFITPISQSKLNNLNSVR